MAEMKASFEERDDNLKAEVEDKRIRAKERAKIEGEERFERELN